MSALEELHELVAKAATGAGTSVVSIGRHGRGSGFVVAANRVLTNAHNLRDRTTQVRFASGRAAQGAVMGSDVDGDLVVLEVDTGDSTPLTWSNAAPATGDVVVSLSAGGNQPRATWGQLTAVERGFRGPRGRRIGGAIEHTAPSAAGSSGAPVLDRDGNVLAVNTHRVDHGFYLARLADTELRERVAAMTEGRRYERVELGVALAPPGVAAKLRRSVGLPERDGLLVRGVVDGSPAQSAGIAEGDLLVRAGDRDLASTDDLFDALAAVQPGGTLTITVVRGADENNMTARFLAGEQTESDD